MLILPNRSPVRYDLCTDTVTVYHKDGETFSTGVYTAFFDNKKNLTIDKTGLKDGNSFLLVIPGNHQMVFPGDKVLRGTGQPITTNDQWRKMIPSTVQDLVVVQTVDVKYWNGQIIHVEAGG